MKTSTTHSVVIFCVAITFVAIDERLCHLVARKRRCALEKRTIGMRSIALLPYYFNDDDSQHTNTALKHTKQSKQNKMKKKKKTNTVMKIKGSHKVYEWKMTKKRR